MLRSSLRRPRAAGQFVTLQEMEDYSTLFLDGEFYVGEDGSVRQRGMESPGKRLYRFTLGVLKDNGGSLTVHTVLDMGALHDILIRRLGKVHHIVRDRRGCCFRLSGRFLGRLSRRRGISCLRVLRWRRGRQLGLGAAGRCGVRPSLLRRFR